MFCAGSHGTTAPRHHGTTAPRRGGPARSSGPYRPLEGGGSVNENTVRTARESVPHSFDFPAWRNPPQFSADVFTFARIIFSSQPSPGTDNYGWWYDYPDADLNLSYRLQQLTALKVDPDGRVLWLSNPDIFDYPFLHIEHVEGMRLNAVEIAALQKYLGAGGVLVVNDFWGTNAWLNLENEMAQVLPGRQWVDLPLSHPIFHCVFEFRGPASMLQVPTITQWNRNYDPNDPNSRASPPRRAGYAGWEDMHVRAWFDNRQHIMVLAVHNSDMPDGWEREGENPDYFRQFSEARSYPLMINILFYLMTH